jgi:ornithine carbamoyltransferase
VRAKARLWRCCSSIRRRTRVSFESGVFELGGHPMVLRANELQLARDESLCDTALVFSRHVSVIGLRTGYPERLAALVEHATVPVVNVLSSRDTC